MRVLVLATDTGRRAELVSLLSSSPGSFAVETPAEIDVGLEAARTSGVDLLICDLQGLTRAEQERLLALSRLGRTPVLVVADDGPGLADRVFDFDQWVTWDRCPAELSIRAARSIRSPRGPATPLADPRFLALVVHDLRTPLNVLNLTIRAIGQSVKEPDPEFEEDLVFLLENTKQLEKMLSQLADYCRLIETDGTLGTMEFQTRRFLADFLEEKQAKRDSEFRDVRLEVAPETPEVVDLDANRVRVALHHALSNALVAAEGPVRLRSRGSSEDWILDVVVDKAPPATIVPLELRSGLFERLIGSAAERRGLDLAIAARITEMFGGTARLDVETGSRSVITLSWPVRSRPV